MKIYVLSSCGEIKQSIKRFLSFVLNWKVEDFNSDISANSICVLIDASFKFDEGLLNTFRRIPSKNISIFGEGNISSKKYICLIKTRELSIKFKNTYNKLELDFSPLFFVKDLGSKINHFFMGHGELSLFSSLNWVKYYLHNGASLIRSKTITWEEYEKRFKEPGVKYWDIFKKRLKKYRRYLEVAGFMSDMSKLSELIKKYDIFINRFEKLSLKRIMGMDEIEFKKKIDDIEKMDFLLCKIKDKLNIKDDAI